MSEQRAGERRIATIDIGTNTALLFVAGWKEGRMLDLHGASGFVRLGEGVDASGRVGPAALARLESVLTSHMLEAAPWNVEELIVTGTSASRDAANADEIRAVVRRVTGCELTILSGDEEAQVTFEGAMAGLSGFDADWDHLASMQAVTVVDVGGGSTEFVQGAVGSSPLRFKQSMNMCRVRMSERFFSTQPPGPEEIAPASDGFRTMMTDSLSGAAATDVCVGASGTAVILSLVHHGRDNMRDMPDGSHMSLEDVQRWSEILLQMTRDEVLALIPRHGKGREDVFPAGVLILRLAMEWMGASKLFISPYGVRQGVAIRHFRKSG
ncbi:MAG: exopolyphosphatase [Bacteroidota bacterium]|nr:exopolyphosphatase [Bacteroidota bacterium]